LARNRKILQQARIEKHVAVHTYAVVVGGKGDSRPKLESEWKSVFLRATEIDSPERRKKTQEATRFA
jgi:hypothetical protein